MAETVNGGQKNKTKKATEEEIDAVPAPDASEQEHQAALTDEVDDMLDEIDSVLEENAEEFVRGYVQKGGQ